ncbi:MAG: iron-sulfur cluster assembly accessory protein, partial [Ferruginibacter sp.]
METTTAIPVTLTASAKDEIRRLMGEEGFDTNQFLRIGVKGGGCSGMTYVLGFDTKTEKDESFEIDGIAIIMEKSHGIYLMGMEVDWQ